MKEFRAKNPKQLDLCLKLLYAEHMGFSVSVSENIKKKIEYVIIVDADEQKIWWPPCPTSLDDLKEGTSKHCTNIAPYSFG